MKTPFDILDVSIDATGAEIKQAYLHQVKKHPPDHDPAQFRTIHDAYLSIKDKKGRLSYELFTLPNAEFDELIERMLHSDQTLQFSADHFNALLQASMNDASLQNIFTDAELK